MELAEVLSLIPSASEDDRRAIVDAWTSSRVDGSAPTQWGCTPEEWGVIQGCMKEDCRYLWNGTYCIALGNRRTKKMRKGPYPTVYSHGRRERGSKVVWETINHRPVTRGMVIRHRCNRNWCVNHLHLEEGSYKENAMDRVEAGTAGKLNNSKALKIRELHHSDPRKYTPQRLATLFRVNNCTIFNVLKGKNWVSAGGPIGAIDGRRITGDDEAEIIHCHHAGMSMKEICRNVGRSYYVVRHVLNQARLSITVRKDEWEKRASAILALQLEDPTIRPSEVARQLGCDYERARCVMKGERFKNLRQNAPF